ncbi:hypothetical protein BOX15_Mlig005604g2 [Macrostomum lignano]|uniref:Tyrosine-protein kinase n=1 Tax=Macrostomum lignano TaxID=282301 RepID=A0A267EEM8_9PLAT|nr:hypothetical protein BOX15_Mlig005604g2 [Macrostomum lignano]
MGAQSTKPEKLDRKNAAQNAFTNYASGQSFSDISQGSSFLRSNSINEDGSSGQRPPTWQSFLGSEPQPTGRNLPLQQQQQQQQQQQLQQQQQQQSLVVAVLDFVATHEGQLSIRRGQQLRLTALGGPGDWSEVESPVSRRRGWVPTNYVVQLSNLHLFTWYHGQVSRRTAEYLLSSGINGSFLVRDSESQPGQLSVSVRCNGRVFHYRINRNSEGGYFVTAEHAFPSLCQLVQHHAVQADGIVCLLLYPAPKRWRANALQPGSEDTWEVERTELVMQQKLGAGQYGDVYQAVWKRCGNLTVAVKTVKEDMSTKVNDFLAEAHIMKHLRHPNLLQILGVCSREPPCYIIAEFMPHGSLLDFLRSQRSQLAPYALLYMATQIAGGMSYMESESYVHRDLAARNCLVGQDCIVKVADFGLTRRLQGASPYVAKRGAKFPIKWTAPEGLAYNQFTSRSDVWSFGVLLWEIATFGCSPYPRVELTDVYRLLESGHRMQRPADCPDSVYQLMLACWQWQPEQRPAFAELHTRLKAICDSAGAEPDDSAVRQQQYQQQSQVQVVHANGGGVLGAASSVDCEFFPPPPPPVQQPQQQLQLRHPSGILATPPPASSPLPPPSGRSKPRLGTASSSSSSSAPQPPRRAPIGPSGSRGGAASPEGSSESNTSSRESLCGHRPAGSAPNATHSSNGGSNCANRPVGGSNGRGRALAASVGTPTAAAAVSTAASVDPNLLVVRLPPPAGRGATCGN